MRQTERAESKGGRSVSDRVALGELSDRITCERDQTQEQEHDQEGGYPSQGGAGAVNPSGPNVDAGFLRVRPVRNPSESVTGPVSGAASSEFRVERLRRLRFDVAERERVFALLGPSILGLDRVGSDLSDRVSVWSEPPHVGCYAPTHARCSTVLDGVSGLALW